MRELRVVITLNAPPVMRRIVDCAIPGGVFIGTLPAATGILPTPPSAFTTFGPLGARLLIASLCLAFGLLTVGVCIRVPAPSKAFVLECATLAYIGATFGVFAVARFAVDGRSGWASAWWVLSITAYCAARFAELVVAWWIVRRHSPQQPPHG